jgi:hypothetical protein
MPPERSAILLLLAGAQIYLLAGFLVYARADFAAWEADLRVFKRDKEAAIRAGIRDGRIELGGSWRVAEVVERESPSPIAVSLRRQFEYFVPIVVVTGSLIAVLVKVVRPL